MELPEPYSFTFMELLTSLLELLKSILLIYQLVSEKIELGIISLHPSPLNSSFRAIGNSTIDSFENLQFHIKVFIQQLVTLSFPS